MKVLLITYDLKDKFIDYSKLFDILKTAPSWWHYIESTWLIATDEPPELWFSKIKNAIGKDDNLFIVEIKGSQRQGWLSQDAWDWIKKYCNT
jgi:hypothetical protein